MQDQLSAEVRKLEGNAGDYEVAARALAMLRVIRAYELRVRSLALRIDYRLARSLTQN